MYNENTKICLCVTLCSFTQYYIHKDKHTFVRNKSHLFISACVNGLIKTTVFLCIIYVGPFRNEICTFLILCWTISNYVSVEFVSWWVKQPSFVYYLNVAITGSFSYIRWFIDDTIKSLIINVKCKQKQLPNSLLPLIPTCRTS